jgi:hypothetical protein
MVPKLRFFWQLSGSTAFTGLPEGDEESLKYRSGSTLYQGKLMPATCDIRENHSEQGFFFFFFR